MCRSHHTRQKYPLAKAKVYNNTLSYFHQLKLSKFCLQEEFDPISCYYAHVIGLFTLYIMAEVVTIQQEKRKSALSVCVCLLCMASR